MTRRLLTPLREGEGDIYLHVGADRQTTCEDDPAREQWGHRTAETRNCSPLLFRGHALAFHREDSYSAPALLPRCRAGRGGGFKLWVITRPAVGLARVWLVPATRRGPMDLARRLESVRAVTSGRRLEGTQGSRRLWPHWRGTRTTLQVAASHGCHVLAVPGGRGNRSLALVQHLPCGWVGS